MLNRYQFADKVPQRIIKDFNELFPGVSRETLASSNVEQHKQLLADLCMLFHYTQEKYFLHMGARFATMSDLDHGVNSNIHARWMKALYMLTVAHK